MVLIRRWMGQGRVVSAQLSLIKSKGYIPLTNFPARMKVPYAFLVIPCLFMKVVAAVSMPNREHLLRISEPSVGYCIGNSIGIVITIRHDRRTCDIQRLGETCVVRSTISP